MEMGRPNWLLKLPSVFPVRKATDSRAAITSFVEVFPALPVTPITSPGHWLRAQAANCPRAFKESRTTRTGPSAARSAITAIAPWAKARSMYSLPS